MEHFNLWTYCSTNVFKLQTTLFFIVVVSNESVRLLQLYNKVWLLSSIVIFTFVYPRCILALLKHTHTGQFLFIFRMKLLLLFCEFDTQDFGFWDLLAITYIDCILASTILPFWLLPQFASYLSSVLWIWMVSLISVRSVWSISFDIMQLKQWLSNSNTK